MNQEKNIKLELSVEEVNVILNALGSRPYVEVFSLVQKIQTQASGQMEEMPPPPKVDKG
jgi:dihydroxyacetone kinase